MADALTTVWYYVGAKVIAVFALLNLLFNFGIHSYINVVMLYVILICISCFIFCLLFAVYFILILEYGNDVRQKANSSNFLI